MIVGGIYSFNNGREVVESNFKQELNEVYEVISKVDAALLKTKTSSEKTMPGKLLYKPKLLNQTFKDEFSERDWRSGIRIPCDYSDAFYTDEYTPSPVPKNAYREMDFIKNRLGVEVQLGKYAFMVYNVCAKMTIFHNKDLIDVGIEIVPLKQLASEMSTGVSYFEQFVWDLDNRGVSDIDIPVLILGIAP